MFVSTRKPFSPTDPDWESYKEFIKLPIPDELFTIDSYLNSYIDDCGSYWIDDLSQLDSVLDLLPRADPETNQYYQLAINVSKEATPTLNSTMMQLGYDISDATCTSSLLNCGPWQGVLADIAGRINELWSAFIGRCRVSAEVVAPGVGRCRTPRPR